ncbi:MAG TPA: hypothetical protein PL009_09890 [Flavipsychrobacter sp.]|nr:hypothetical protein [Flavipsychrobacter sp.]
MTNSGRDSGKGPATRKDNEKSRRDNVMNRRDEQLDEELRGQLRKKNEENRKAMNDNSGRDSMDTD